MEAIKMVACVFLGAAACSAAPNRIVGGDPTTVEKYPSIVQVESMSIWSNTWSQYCAANILNSVYVLSAAHCFEGQFYERGRRRIRAGSTYRNTGGFLTNIVREFNHPSYDPLGVLGVDGDISVIRLVDALTFSPVIQAGPIISPGAELPDGSPVVHAGWGATYYQGSSSSQLLDVTIYTINFELCRERYASLQRWPHTVTEKMICAGILDEGGKDACHGDSGGPLYYNSQDMNILVGIVSWGQGCAHEYFPGVSTKVSSYTEWIIQTAV